MKNDLYIVTAYAQKPSGRVDCSTSVKHVSGLKGKLLENAMKVCETQAKRRVTLSICGLGMLDETEVSDIVSNTRKPVNLLIKEEEKIDHEYHTIMADFDDFVIAIENSKTEDQLKMVFNEVKKYNFKTHPELLKQLINLKDEQKGKLAVVEFNKDFVEETGEVK